MLFATVISPILDYLVALIAAALETAKGKMALKVAEYNAKITKLEEEPETATTTNPIGFAIPEEEDDYDEEED